MTKNTSSPMCAQRRPGHQPRRHMLGRERANPRRPRSTKAGASTPATLGPSRRSCRRRTASLNGRPGHQPRRHIPTQSTQSAGNTAALNEGRGINPGDTFVRRWDHHRPGDRSTKAGASTPATRHSTARHFSPPAPLNEGRGINPGDTFDCPGAERTRSALNEGRGINPGDTQRRQRSGAVVLPRSTKAGASTPATPSRR